MSETLSPGRFMVDRMDNLPAGSARVYTIDDREVAVFNIEGRLFAIDDRCPHSGASLGLGSVSGNKVTCPWHAWEFDLENGACTGRTCGPLTRFALTIEGEDVLVDLPAASDEDLKSAAEWPHAYLVRFGAMGWVARFGSREWIECAHGDRVLIKTPRGIELGQILSPPRNGEATLVSEPPSGELLELVTDAKFAGTEHERAPGFPQSALTECQTLLEGREIPVDLIDAELLFDQKTVVLYYLGQPSGALEDVAVEAGKKLEIHLLFHPVVEPAEGQGGCGSGGCGSGGCGT